MNLRADRSPRLLIVATVSAVLLTSAACSSSDSDSANNTGTTTGKDTTLAAMVPADIRKSGVLNVASEIYPPAVISESGKEPSGWDVETTRAIAETLGLKATFTIVPFDSIVPGLQAGRYQAAAGEIFITPERTKVVTFVQTHVSDDSLLVKKGNTINGSSQDALCGLTLSAQLGSAEAALANKIAKSCSKKTTVQVFQDQSQVNLALSQGKSDAAIGSTSQVAYTVKQAPTQFALVKLPWSPQTPTGIALARNKNTAQLAKAIQAATNKLIKSGKLQQILKTYNGGLGSIEQAKIVPASGS